MLNSKPLLFLFLCFPLISCFAQNCNLSIEGHIFDEASGFPLSYVNIYIQETASGTTTDDDGNFTLEGVCVGEYHFIISHIGCEAEEFHLVLSQDTSLNIALAHNASSLGTVIVEAKKKEFANQASLSINRQNIEDNTNKNLASLLENEAGVHLIKNGSGISKPVVHGLYGNRLTILNNGIAQSGQQWGNDHSPEIDPFSADKITVLKGASALEFGGNILGSVILVEPKPIDREGHLHGQINYAYESNGRGHAFNTRVGKYSPVLAWRVSGSLKKYGDRRTAKYFLNNTGMQEANFSLQLEKSWNDRFSLDLYVSSFNTRLGILRGSHIGNITDLESALTREVPFFTESDFSYGIDAPKQEVSHHLTKLKAKYFIDENQFLDFVIAAQINHREEFDIRRSGRTDIPALSLLQYAFDTELKYTKHFDEDWTIKLGSQSNITDNTNNPETDILPLIPDYISVKSGLFTTLSKQKNKFDINIGLRYDFENQDIVAIGRSIPREIIRYKNRFHNLGGLLSIKYALTKLQSLSWNIGYAVRNPAINELYSSGLHQGVSGIEEGDVNLTKERLLKNTLEYNWLPNADFSFNVLLYHQHFSDYIFLNPQDTIRPTIRGAFPVFKYEQTDANIYGLDVSTQFTLGRSFFGLLKYSYLKGNDRRNNTPLVFMPPNSLFGSLLYRVAKTINVSEDLLLKESEIEISTRWVAQQKHILPEQEFVLPPSMYNLIGLKLSTNVVFQNYKIRCFVKADNLLNSSYRDYLNRQRFFADDLGSSWTIGMNLKF